MRSILIVIIIIEEGVKIMKYAYTNAYILDGTENMEPLSGYAVLTDGEIIEAIVPDDHDFSEYTVVDLEGQYLLPGLINMHVHLPASGKPKKKPTDPVKLVKTMTKNSFLRRATYTLCKSYAKTELLSGVTTMRTVGGIANVDSLLRNRIIGGKDMGPRILSADMAISVPGGHMADSLAYSAQTEEEAAAYVRKIAKNNPDLIKLMITGGVLDAKVKGEPGVLKMQPELVKAACDEAHRLGMKVAAHVESPEGVRVALENGVDTIEHGAEPDEQIIQLFKEKKASHIATISPALPYALFDREISHVSEMEQYNGNVVFRGILDCAKACLKNGIPVGLGTDTGCPYITHYDMWREINYFHKYCDVSTKFALYTATLGNAKIAQLDDKIGSIEAGKSADFIVCPENPLDDLTVLRNLSLVVARGKAIKNPKIRKMPEVEKELDKFI